MDDILQLFKDRPDCEEWINKYLAEMRSATGVTIGNTGVDTSNIRNIIEAFRKDGNIYTDGVPDGIGSGETGPALEGRPAVSMNYGSTEEQTANVILHEIIHWAAYLPISDGSKGYFLLLIRINNGRIIARAKLGFYKWSIE